MEMDKIHVLFSWEIISQFQMSWLRVCFCWVMTVLILSDALVDSIDLQWAWGSLCI